MQDPSFLTQTPEEKSWWRQLLNTLLPAITLVLTINLFLAQPRIVHGQSMEPSLHESQRVIIDLLSYRFRPPRRGEIIVLRISPKAKQPPLIKRVIGLPGELVAIHDGAVYINGHPLQEPYLAQNTPGQMPSRRVPPGHVFVLGDNRAHSNDSRYFGMVPMSQIIGRAWLCYWPPSAIGFFH